jgi:N utilization substance protein A
VDYSEDPAEFVANALSPARVTRVDVVDPVAMEARVVVPDYQLSLAIGKEGQNARLAARLTGWRIDIRSDAAPVEPAAEPVEPAAEPVEPAAEPEGAAPETAGAAGDAAPDPAPAPAGGAVSQEARAVPRQGRDAKLGAPVDNAGKA